ncbi:MAG: glycoside hydrolase family 19 protein [Pseudomonadota bacterium]
MEAILNAFVEFGNGNGKALAYALATAYHETGTLMVPVREGFAKTDHHARALVSDRKYGSPGSTGHVYYGRGHVQLTWEKNYRETGNRLGIDLVSNPDLMLESDLSARVLVEGLIDGRWNGDGFGIAHYLPENGPDDLEGARRTVNITDKWSTIANHFRVFLSAIEASGGVPTTVTEPDCDAEEFGAELEEENSKTNLAEILLPVLIALIELMGKANHGRDAQVSPRSNALSGILSKLKPKVRANKAELTPINSWLGNAVGALLDGRKTGFGIAGMLVTALFPVIFPESGNALLEALAPEATSSEEVAAALSDLFMTLFAALTGWGVLGKTEKWVNELAQLR